MPVASMLALLLLARLTGAMVFNISSLPVIPGLEAMSSDKYPHFTLVEHASRTKSHRHRREVIAGPIYDWQSYEIPYQIWGGDCELGASRPQEETRTKRESLRLLQRAPVVYIASVGCQWLPTSLFISRKRLAGGTKQPENNGNGEHEPDTWVPTLAN